MSEPAPLPDWLIPSLILLSILSLWVLLTVALVGWPKLARLRFFLIFLTLGPPFGFLWPFVLSLALSSQDSPRLVPAILEKLLLGLLFSYPFGFIPAAISAVFVYLIGRYMPVQEWFYVLLAGVVVGILYSALFYYVFSGSFMISELLKHINLCLAPTLFCWYLNKRLDRAARPAGL